TAGTSTSAGGILGGSELEYPGGSGLRLTAGYWLDDPCTRGVEVSGFFLERRAAGGGVRSDITQQPTAGTPAAPTGEGETGGTAPAAANAFGILPLVRPVIDARSGQLTLLPVAQQDVLFGRIAVSSAARFWGAEANFVAGVYKQDDFTGELLLGFRYAD